MNKLTKIGASALCGSLAAVSAASAGELTVKGGATATWSSNEGTVTGNPIGLSSGITMTGSGELDNGTTFALTLTQADQSAYSTGNISITTPSLGSFRIGQTGGGLDRLDDMMPTAWEETTGTSLGTGISTVNGVAGSSNVTWTLPADMLPSGLGVQFAYTPRGQSAMTNDKGVGGDAGGFGSGYDIVLDYNALVDGLNIFGGYSAIEQAAATTGGAGGVMGGADGDRTQKVMGATYAVGGFTLGYQYSLDAKQSVSGAATSFYENDAYGISFAINDDLSISYGSHKSDRNLTNGTNVEAEATSLQLAYSMGGASLKIAETSGDNLAYSTATDRDATTLALSLAF
jgi:outer membrane protein OmpU